MSVLDPPVRSGLRSSDTPAHAAPVLRVSHLYKSFGAVQAVDDVSFEVLPGQVVSIIGPNGSGKTSTINVLTGLLSLDSGSIELDGRRIERLSAEQRAELGLGRTFQNGRVFANMAVADNVFVGLYAGLQATRPWSSLRHRPVLRWVSLLSELALALSQPRSVGREMNQVRAGIARQLERFGDRLSPRAQRPAFTLSYANRRRTEIARALASNPRVLLLDEPTAGMNQTETAEVLGQLLQLKGEGQTMVLVEHKIDLVMALSDRIIVMDNGQIIADGPPADVRGNERVIEAYLGRPQRREREQAVERGNVETTVAATAAPPALELRDVDVFYGAAQALQSVSLEVREGEIVSLLGGNASGKSTTMKTVLGLLKPKSGHVLLDGEPADHLSTAERIRRGLASVPEARRVFPGMTVEENLLTGAFTRSGRRDVQADLDRMYTVFPRLAERRKQLAGSFSGGEQQMLAFARALMSRPRLICMDEPTMGLSPLLVERVLEMIVDINARMGVAVFMVEQNAELALSIANRGYVLQTGRIVLDGPASALLGNDLVREAYLGKTIAGATHE